VKTIHSQTVNMLAQPDVKERLARLGAEAVGNSPAEFAAFIRAEIGKWARIVKQAGLKAQ
jgi:tripartite-type tricarboxylate transporter receptor subunit TctC